MTDESCSQNEIRIDLIDHKCLKMYALLMYAIIDSFTYSSQSVLIRISLEFSTQTIKLMSLSGLIAQSTPLGEIMMPSSQID